MTSARDVIDSALALAEDVHAGKIDPAGLDAELVDECRQLLGQVVGERDPLWPLHVDIARQVLGVGGLPADELSEWLAVARRRAQIVPTPSAGFTAPDMPSGAESAVSEPHSPASGPLQPGIEREDYT
jgi:hypothetical protein